MSSLKKECALWLLLVLREAKLIVDPITGRISTPEGSN